MKNRKWPNIMTTIVVILFILGLFLGTATAITPGEQYEKAREQNQIIKERFDKAKENFQEVKDRYEAARLKFRSAKNNISREELKTRTKEYIERAIDQMIANLEIVKNRIQSSLESDKLPFDAVDIIDEHVNQLQDIKTNIQQANTSQELVDSYRELKDLWVKTRLESRYAAGILINHRIDGFLEKTDNLSERMDTVILKLKDWGVDVTKLEEEASSFNNLVSEARTDHQKTLELYATHEGFDSNGMVTDNKDAEAFLREADSSQKGTLRKLRSATKDVRDFFIEAKKSSGGKVIVRGTGTLEANGTGRAIIAGNVTVTLSGNATLVVSSNADVTTDGTGTKEVLGSGDVKYQGFGSATITGENVNVVISGNDITLKAEGTGSAILRGKGTYRTEKDFAASGEWKKED